VRAIQGQETLLLQLLVVLVTTFADLLFGFSQILGSQLLLHANQLFDQRLILLEHLVVALGHGTRDNERSTGIVNQHGVNLVDDGVVMGSLYQVGRRDGHVVTQIVETELVVGTERDVGLVSLATLWRVGLVLVDTVHRKAVEHIERPHPLGVTLGQIVVDGYDVDAVARQGVQEHGQGSHEGLTFTRCHLGNLTLMQNDTTKQLNVVVDHFPLQVVATSGPMVMIDSLVAIDGDEVLAGVGSQFTVEVGGRNDGLLVLGKAAGRLLDDGEHLGHHLVEGLLVNLEHFLLQLVDLGEDVGTLVNGRVLDGGLQAFNLCFLFLG